MEHIYIDDENLFPDKKIARVLNLVKPAFMMGLKNALKMVPKESLVNSEEKCSSSEMKRQWKAYTRAVERWSKDWMKYPNPNLHDGTNRTMDSINTIKIAYFTALQYEANYMVLSAYIFDEYKKIRESGEKIE